METIDIVKPYAQAALSTLETLANTYEMTQYCILHDIPGDLVECGVAYGGQLIAMEQASKGNNRTIWVIDSFMGIPLCGPKDDSQPGLEQIKHNQNLHIDERLVSSGVDVVSAEKVAYNLAYFNCDMRRFKFIEGWFQHTLPYLDFGPIALLRLDGDLYESTMTCLENLYPRVSKGGVVIIDDWALTGCRAACDEYFHSNGISPRIFPVKNSTPVFFFKE